MPPPCMYLLLLRPQQEGTDYQPYPLPPSPWKYTQHPRDNDVLVTPLKKYKRVLLPRSSLIELPFGFPKLTEKGNHRHDEEAQEQFPRKVQEISCEAETMQQTSVGQKTLSSKGVE